MSSEDEARLIERARSGDAEALDRLLDRHRLHLARSIELRLDRRVRNRVDPADILQEAMMEASRRITDWAGEEEIPFRMWLRVIARQKVIDVHRRHLDAAVRDVRREDAGLLATSVDAAARLLAQRTSPSSAAARAEERAMLESALALLDPTDREILVSRHVEQLRNQDVARELGIDAKAASKRYVRALARLREALKGLSG
jgi:RNA polymerase sigma-70 factor (ECF subfamily)